MKGYKVQEFGTCCGNCEYAKFTHDAIICMKNIPERYKKYIDDISQIPWKKENFKLMNYVIKLELANWVAQNGICPKHKRRSEK